MATPTGFEPAIFGLTGRYVKPLHHGAADKGRRASYEWILSGNRASGQRVRRSSGGRGVVLRFDSRRDQGGVEFRGAVAYNLLFPDYGDRRGAESHPHQALERITVQRDVTLREGDVLA